MGFSLKKMFSGSGWKKFKGVVGGVVKLATSVIPGVGGLAGKAAGALLGAKTVKNVGGLVDKLGGVNKLSQLSKNGRSTAMVLKMSPVMPGGAVSTPRGMEAPNPYGPPPPWWGASGSSTRRSSSTTKRKKKAPARRKATTRKRSTRGRLPKFGSPAWRKKFGLDKKKRKKRAK